MHIEQALDFIHACPPAKFEGLSDLLSPELVQACLAETGSVSLRRRRMPMERVLWTCSGLMNPDTILGGTVTTLDEVFNDQKTSFLFC